MRVHWGNIHLYILGIIFLNFIMIYILKDKSESIKENDNIIEITREQARIILENHSKSYIERKRQKEIKNKKHNEKRAKKKLEKMKKYENNNKNNLRNENFKQPKMFVEEINKDNLNVSPEEITNDNYYNAIFSFCCLILIVIIACYFQYRNNNFLIYDNDFVLYFPSSQIIKYKKININFNKEYGNLKVSELNDSYFYYY